MSDSFNASLKTLFEKMENFVSTKTVVGEPSQVGDVIIVPLVDVSFGVGAGVSEGEKTENKSKQDITGGGLGAKITPSAVLVITKGNVQLVNVKNQDSINKLIDMVPGFMSKINFGSFGKTNAETAEAPKADIKFDETTITE